MPLEPDDVRPGAQRPMPTGAGGPVATRTVVIEADRSACLAEDQRARDEQIGIDARVVPGDRRLLGGGLMARRADEPPELRDGDRPLVDPEVVDRDVTDRGLFGIEPARAHPEDPP